MLHFLSFMLEMYEDMLVWTTNDNYCFDVGISGKTNEDMDPDEYVADADECD